MGGGKPFKTDTFAYTLSRLVQYKRFIILAILRYAADSKADSSYIVSLSK